ncbi:Hsp20/alpha crystallin family protein [Halarchaeum sp. P4]|uniref:Hsp20/alpha crystallin family protein n=1 Tax=Halarchaeum sp. P4 TaxID=3421639 RepID=UPI003EB8A58B
MSRLRDALRELPDAVFADFAESDDAYRLVFDVPGVSADTVDVDVRAYTLHVDARREKDVPDGFDYRREERAVFLEFEVPLPPNVASADATATLENGVLDVVLPKSDGDGVRVPVEG